MAGALVLTAIACSPSGPAPLFVDLGAESGLDFVHDNGMSGNLYFSEVVGSGAALFDFDNDGDLDLYLVQGGALEAEPSSAEAAGDRLLRNDTLVDGGLRLVDVTVGARIRAPGYGMGVAAGDVDGNGATDLYVTNFGANQLLLNQGDGTFTDATTPSLAEPRWTTSATFLDYDRDGDLDLFAANYVDYRLAQHRPCLNAAGAIEYCGPGAFPPETDRLWRNDGAGLFTDVTGVAGIIDLAGSGLGVVSADFDGDLWPDIYVANDLMPNHLWLNRGDGTFVEDALLAGCAVNENGAPEASMGLAVADFDRDGDEDLFMTHLDTETNTAFVNEGGLFSDASNEWGLSVPSVGLTGFGTVPIDIENDGWIDLVTANGAVKTIAEQRAAGDPLPLREPNLLLRNMDVKFEVVTGRSPALAKADVSRGAAAGDIDNDGDDDLLILNNNGPAQLLRNETGQDGPWIGVALSTPNGEGVATEGWVTLRRGSDRSLHAARSGESYCSASDPRVLAGGARGASALEVRTPFGPPRRLLGIRPGAYYRLRGGGL